MKKLFIVFYASFFSCTTHIGPELQEVNLNDLSRIYPPQMVDINTIARSKEFIPLASGGENPIMGEISLLRETENFFFILTRENILFKFDKQGNFITTIGTHGRGPEEFLDIRHFALDDKAESIYILDYFGRKLMLFDYSGKFVESWPVPESTYPTSFFLDGGAVVFSSDYNAYSPEVNRYDLASKTTTQISRPERIMGMEGLINTTYELGIPERRHIYHYFNDTVYLYKENRLVPDYLLRISPHRLMFNELLFTDGGNYFRDPRIQFINIVETYKYTFATYTITHFQGDRKNPLSFWSSDFKTFYPNVAFVESGNDAIGIDSDSPFFMGSEGRSIIVSKNAYTLQGADLPFEIAEDDNDVLVRYLLK